MITIVKKNIYLNNHDKKLQQESRMASPAGRGLSTFYLFLFLYIPYLVMFYVNTIYIFVLYQEKRYGRRPAGEAIRDSCCSFL